MRSWGMLLVTGTSELFQQRSWGTLQLRRAGVAQAWIVHVGPREISAGKAS